MRQALQFNLIKYSIYVVEVAPTLGIFCKSVCHDKARQTAADDNVVIFAQKALCIPLDMCSNKWRGDSMAYDGIAKEKDRTKPGFHGDT